MYLYLVIDVWSRKVVALDVAEREDPATTAELVNRACLRKRISKGRKQPLMPHADNGNAMRAATLESQLEELGVLQFFSRPRVSNDNPYSEPVFRTKKYRPDYPRRPLTSVGDACLWIAEFVDWCNHRHRHSGIKYVTPHQRHNGDAAGRSAVTALSPTSRHGSSSSAGGHPPHVAGVNRKWSGSIHHLQKATPKKLRLSWLHNQLYKST